MTIEPAHKRFRMTLEGCRWGIGAGYVFMDTSE